MELFKANIKRIGTGRFSGSNEKKVYVNMTNSKELLFLEDFNMPELKALESYAAEKKLPVAGAISRFVQDKGNPLYENFDYDKDSLKYALQIRSESQAQIYRKNIEIFEREGGVVLNLTKQSMADIRYGAYVGDRERPDNQLDFKRMICSDFFNADPAIPAAWAKRGQFQCQNMGKGSRRRQESDGEEDENAESRIEFSVSVGFVELADKEPMIPILVYRKQDQSDESLATTQKLFGGFDGVVFRSPYDISKLIKDLSSTARDPRNMVLKNMITHVDSGEKWDKFKKNIGILNTFSLNEGGESEVSTGIPYELAAAGSPRKPPADQIPDLERMRVIVGVKRKRGIPYTNKDLELWNSPKTPRLLLALLGEKDTIIESLSLSRIPEVSQEIQMRCELDSLHRELQRYVESNLSMEHTIDDLSGELHLYREFFRKANGMFIDLLNQTIIPLAQAKLPQKDQVNRETEANQHHD